MCVVVYLSLYLDVCCGVYLNFHLDASCSVNVIEFAQCVLFDSEFACR